MKGIRYLQQFQGVCETLEKHYHDMQDMEFTVEHGKLYMLQTRPAPFPPFTGQRRGAIATSK